MAVQTGKTLPHLRPMDSNLKAMNELDPQQVHLGSRNKDTTSSRPTTRKNDPTALFGCLNREDPILTINAPKNDKLKATIIIRLPYYIEKMFRGYRTNERDNRRMRGAGLA